MMRVQMKQLLLVLLGAETSCVPFKEVCQVLLL